MLITCRSWSPMRGRNPKPGEANYYFKLILSFDCEEVVLLLRLQGIKTIQLFTMLANKLAIATPSLGQHPSHSLDRKILAAAKAGFNGLEIVFSHLDDYCQKNGLSIQDGARKIKALCDAKNVEALSVAPFENFEGDRSPLKERLQTASLWIEVARILQAPYLQIPSHFGPDAVGDYDVIISELRQIADIGSAQEPVVSMAYEALSWGTHCSTWEDSLKIVDDVNRPNFGLCLDNFHVVTKLWADAFSPSGRFPDADQKLKESLDNFKNCPVEKIFYVQLSDGEKFDPPFSKKHPWYVEGEASQFTWSKHARPFPFESELGAYMPILEFVQTWVIEKGFKGWISLEIFDRRMREESSQPDANARRGIESWKKLIKALGAPASRI